MRSVATIPFLVCGGLVALVVVITLGVLFGSVGLGPEPRSAEAAFLDEVKKLLTSNTGPEGRFGKVAVKHYHRRGHVSQETGCVELPWLRLETHA